MAVLFDTLKLAERLEAAGLPLRQARDMAAAFAETMTGDVATRQDIELLRRDIDQTRHDLDHLREHVDLRFGEVEARLGQRITEAEARLLRPMLTHALATIGAVAAIVGLAAALTRLFH
jgi:hypothetical protein